MKFSYKFSNLLGTIYRCGNLVFTPDGNSIISPVGNRLTIYDLKNNKARTLDVESRFNYTAIALSPDGSLLLAANEHGQAQLISMISCMVIHQHKFKDKVQYIAFSPSGAFFAVAMQNLVLVFKSPGELTGEYNPFVLERTYLGGYDDVSYLDWSSDSRFLLVGCRDSTTKVIGRHYMKNFRTFILSGHTDAIVSCFFEANSLHANTISRNGQLCLWECSLTLSDFNDEEKQSPIEQKRTKIDGDNSDEESEDEIEETVEKRIENVDSLTENIVDENEHNDNEGEKKCHPFYYKKLARHYLADEPRKEQRDVVLTAAYYNKRIKILVVGFSNGSFYLYELPDVNMIHSLTISDYAISTALFNSTGDWVALASKELGQLLVWEWQSEQYIMKQQGHSSEMICISYSPDGQYIATGGEDSKVKLWNTQSGFCFVTFTEHTSAITAVQFSRSKKFLVSSSLDGTVRAFDITRYRNFRTFTSPRLIQFSCVAVDYSDELIVAGGQDVFEIYLWSIKLGTLLEVISGHEAPVSSLAFAPVPTSSTLVSGSWDKTIKIWNCLETKSEHETIDLLHDVTCVCFNPNGEHVAVATLNAGITVFDVKTATQISSIEGRKDLASGRLETDIITAKRNQLGRYFSTIEYSVDGECILAAGRSHAICIYHVKEGILLKKFEITQNRSFDGLNEYINRRNMTEFGNMALIEQREETEGGKVAIRLPGVQKGDMAARHFKPEVKVFSVKFSPTGQSFAAACTEGLCIYSLDKGVVFDPFNLSLEVTPKAVKDAVKNGEFSKALIMALKLNETNLIMFSLESIPFEDVQLVISDMPNEYAHRLLPIIARLLQTSPHIEFYLEWSCKLLLTFGNKDGVFQHSSLLALHESLSHKYEALNKICDFNKYTLRALFKAFEEKQKRSNSQNIKDANGTKEDDTNSEDEEMILIKSNESRTIRGTNDKDMQEEEESMDE
ncbi:periodic tryptophan protein 2 homolog isoform X1 [Glossina fuscipes]|uniref:Periodic tryptophan protein 2 homolog isoform X1 n=1 Tax=Glossina fuscipes TaxID=7396 RepID=A0A9C6DNE3_9MUSC|nr:periodic tryptophan protein 2 homolog isoform X1 [Glossina fuscipes]